MVSGVSPFHQPGAGKLTSTVNCPDLAGVIGIEPFVPNSSHFPIISAAVAGGAIIAIVAKTMAAAPPRTVLILCLLSMDASCRCASMIRRSRQQHGRARGLPRLERAVRRRRLAQGEGLVDLDLDGAPGHDVEQLPRAPQQV